MFYSNSISVVRVPVEPLPFITRIKSGTNSIRKGNEFTDLSIHRFSRDHIMDDLPWQ